MQPVEEWRSIPGYEGQYEVSSLGRVRSLDRLASDGRSVRGTIKTLRTDRQGYLRVSFATGKRSVKSVHRVADLSLLAFVGPKPPGMQARHLNGSRKDNTITNLTYGTPSQNGADAAAHGRLKGPNVRRACNQKPVISAEVIAAVKAASSSYEAARLYGVEASYARAVRANRVKSWAD